MSWGFKRRLRDFENHSQGSNIRSHEMGVHKLVCISTHICAYSKHTASKVCSSSRYIRKWLLLPFRPSESDVGWSVGRLSTDDDRRHCCCCCTQYASFERWHHHWCRLLLLMLWLKCSGTTPSSLGHHSISANCH